ncbi:hypothetical protein DXG01_012617 [Tephrocybe rancida]|nr:hypothetical protein DXG01_012617 [Tephrocybe rancida]
MFHKVALTALSFLAILSAQQVGTLTAVTHPNLPCDDALTLKFVTKGANTNVGSHLYLMNSESENEPFKFVNQNFTFDVGASNLPCGLAGALYFSENGCR